MCDKTGWISWGFSCSQAEANLRAALDQVRVTHSGLKSLSPSRCFDLSWDGHFLSVNVAANAAKSTNSLAATLFLMSWGRMV